MIAWPLFRYTLLAVRRDRVMQILVILMALGASASFFLGSAAVIEQHDFSVALVGTFLRTISVLGLVIFISFFLRRAFDSREIDYLLATPVTRLQLISTFSIAFITVALVLTGVIGLVMGVLAHDMYQGLVLWIASVATELAITAMIALFFAIVLRSATISALCSLGYYALARMMGMMIGIVEARLIDDGSPLFKLMRWIVKIISIVTPRFDLVAQTAWVVHKTTESFQWWILPVQAAVFCFLFMICAAFDLRRSQF